MVLGLLWFSSTVQGIWGLDEFDSLRKVEGAGVVGDMGALPFSVDVVECLDESLLKALEKLHFFVADRRGLIESEEGSIFDSSARSEARRVWSSGISSRAGDGLVCGEGVGMSTSSDKSTKEEGEGGMVSETEEGAAGVDGCCVV